MIHTLSGYKIQTHFMLLGFMVDEEHLPMLVEGGTAVTVSVVTDVDGSVLRLAIGVGSSLFTDVASVAGFIVF